MRLLLCTDLDRTLLPNGHAEESAGARKYFARLVKHPQVTLVYVSGRDRELVRASIDEYGIPEPDYLIADVGSTIYNIEQHDWHRFEEWHRRLNDSWHDLSTSQLQSLIGEIDGLRLQEAHKQGEYKLSFYAPLNINREVIEQRIQHILDEQGITASLVWSIDDMQAIGLLDVLPENASKQLAIEFLAAELGIGHDCIVFAGDSGNDVSVMLSGIRSILVANASDDLRNELIDEIHARKIEQTLYIASGGYLSMNGNYSAGIMEGVVHFFPQVRTWIEGET